MSQPALLNGEDIGLRSPFEVRYAKKPSAIPSINDAAIRTVHIQSKAHLAEQLRELGITQMTLIGVNGGEF